MTRRVLPIDFVARRSFRTPALSGFVVLEWLATLALLGSLAAVGVNTLHRDEPQVAGSVQLLAADLLWARSEAVRLETPVRVTFSAASNSYRVTFDPGDRPPRLAFERSLNRDFPLASLVGADPALTQTLLFDSRGLPQGLQTAAKIEVASSLDPSFKRCLFVGPRGLLTYNETCAL